MTIQKRSSNNLVLIENELRVDEKYIPNHHPIDLNPTREKITSISLYYIIIHSLPLIISFDHELLCNKLYANKLVLSDYLLNFPHYLFDKST